MKKRNKGSDEFSSDNRAVIKFQISDVVMTIILVILCLTCIFPFIHLFSKSISSNAAVLAKEVYFLPKGFSLEAYKAILKDGQLTHSMIYSAVVTILQTIIGVSSCIMAAWPLSRKRLKGRTGLNLFIMFTMYFNAGLIPTYLLLSDLNLLNTIWVLILPGAFGSYNFLIMRTYFAGSIPESLEEAAYLDGASNLQILSKIVVPLSKPIIATISLFIAVGRWNGYSDSKFYITKKSMHMIQYLLSMMVIPASESERVSLAEASAVTTTPEVIQAAAIMFVTIPILCVYPFIQKYFVKGVMIGAVKE